MKAEIIAIGSEILLGDIVNTNAQYLARELANLGIDVYHQQVVGDNEERLLRAYDEAYKRSDLIITTGGLGPTQDDITKESAAKYFNKKLKLDEDTLKSIEKYFNKQGRELKGNNVKQAYFPEGAIISMPLKAEGMSKGKAFFYGTLSGVVEPIGATMTILLTNAVVPILPYLLSFAAGAMIYVVVEELIPESQAGEHSNIGTVGVAIGFVIMMILDVALG